MKLRQIADMEKDGADVDLDPAAAAMRDYAQAGLDTFDMADHCELHAAHSPEQSLWHQPAPTAEKLTYMRHRW